MIQANKTVMTFPFYLDAWCYCRKHNIRSYVIKKTGLREMTLTFRNSRNTGKKVS